jgi:membrane fusion protein (multidrug efflux system)
MQSKESIDQGGAAVVEPHAKTPARPAGDAAAQGARPHSSPHGAKKKKHGPIYWLVVSIIALLALVWSARFAVRMYTYEETDDAYVTGHVHIISARIAGTVQEVLVTDNQEVKAGQILARIDPLEFQIALQKAQAALAQARAQEAQAQAGESQARADSMQAEAMASQAQARVEQTKAQLDLANVNLGRNEQLYQQDQRAVSKSEVDTTRGNARANTAALAAADADLAAAKAREQAADASTESAQAQVAAAHANTAAAGAAVQDAQRELSYTTIIAPVDGRVGNKNIEIGNRVQAGQALVAIVSKEIWVVANFKETQLKQMHAGQPVEITVDAIDGHHFTGRLDSISPATGAEFALLPPDNATGNFTKVVQRVPVKVVLDPASVGGNEDRLRPGLSTVVSVRVR